MARRGPDGRDSGGPEAAKRLPRDAESWVVRMHSDQATRADHEALAAWLDADPARRAQYHDAHRIWALAATMRGPLTRRSEGRIDRRAVLLGGGAAAAASVAGLVWSAHGSRLDERVFETAVGEQRRALLTDGSLLSLNAGSRVRVRIGAHERLLWLDRGVAFFEVAKDKKRPFRVFAGADEVRALGTQFEVRRNGEQTRVALREGSVAIYRGDDTGAATIARPGRVPDLVMRPGEQVVVVPRKPIELAAIAVDRVAAWRRGVITLEARTLASAIDEFNGYNTQKIEVIDPRLNNLRVSGVFQTSEPGAFVEALVAAFPVTVASMDERRIRLDAAADKK